VPKRTQLFDKTSLAIEVGGILFWSAKKKQSVWTCRTLVPPQMLV
jgi:hypothetical protein